MFAKRARDLVPPSIESVLYDRDAASLLYKNGLGSVVVSMATSSVLAFAFTDDVPSLTKWLWWSAMMIILLVRGADIIHWQKFIAHTEFDGKKHTRRFCSLVVIVSLCWALFPVVAFKYLDTYGMASSLILMTAMAGGASAVLSANRFTALFFITCLCIPFSTYCIFSENSNIVYIGFLGYAFTLAVFNAAFKSSHFTKESITLRHDNINLLDTMERRVTERTKALNRLANYDTLTGLLNRKFFLIELQDLMQQASSTKKQLALFFVDLDGFKEINDIQGHAVGDMVLTKISKRFGKIPGIESEVCRWGGDEFIATAFLSTTEDILQQANRIKEILVEPIEMNDDSLQIDSTIGVALYPSHAVSESDLIHYADLAMYSKKKQLKGGISIFEEGLLKAAHYEQELSHDLHSAINKDQLFLVYQPIIGIGQQGSVYCVEALLRWQRNDTLIPPSVFIPIAENSGTIVSIGAWVLQTACRTLMSWNISARMSVSVNVSLRQLMDVDFIEHVEVALQESKLEASRLHIEITESLFEKDMALISKKLNRLQSMGVKVSIDDFGTGFSSLSYLHALPVDQIKIDQSFVRNIQKGSDPIVAATISMARSLDYEVVAEGIETEEERDKLLEMGADYLQGYFYSRPMAADLVEDWYRAQVDQPAKKL